MPYLGVIVYDFCPNLAAAPVHHHFGLEPASIGTWNTHGHEAQRFRWCTASAIMNHHDLVFIPMERIERHNLKMTTDRGGSMQTKRFTLTIVILLAILAASGCSQTANVDLAVEQTLTINALSTIVQATLAAAPVEPEVVSPATTTSAPPIEAPCRAERTASAPGNPRSAGISASARHSTATRGSSALRTVVSKAPRCRRW